MLHNHGSVDNSILLKFSVRVKMAEQEGGGGGGGGGGCWERE